MTKTDTKSLEQNVRDVITPRPLSYDVDTYWKAPADRANPDMSSLGYQWADKPHRLLYDLIAHILYLSTPAPVDGGLELETTEEERAHWLVTASKPNTHPQGWGFTHETVAKLIRDADKAARLTALLAAEKAARSHADNIGGEKAEQYVAERKAREQAEAALAASEAARVAQWHEFSDKIVELTRQIAALTQGATP